ncbi:DUF5642 family protein [Mycobacterium sp.]|uniref:DUF5642 family protein n=1 Tax=Mycobacterium sp. TaxID=1785 RepID=UPI002C82EF31|nr:DUF5642 family protein [Mycobacterium sp.]HME46669.1 DUF5642 family protein [Mycobacterium sp.]
MHGFAARPTCIRRTHAQTRRRRFPGQPRQHPAAAGGLPARLRGRRRRRVVVTDGFWGLGADSSADPAQCASLADPLGGRGASPQGLSGSGAGGIVYVVVAGAPAPPVVLDAAVVDDRARWSMAAARTTATVALTPAPPIEGAATMAMHTALRTVVEGGTQTEVQAQTATAYLGDCLVFVTVVTDPGSPQPQLPPDFASTFLVRTAATLRDPSPGG